MIGTKTTSSAKLFENSKTKQSFKIASMPDIHIGHHRTLTPDILEGLYKVFKDDKEISTWDMLVLPGDFFDRLLFLTNPFFGDILYFIGFLFMRCHEYDITILSVEGTPAHDNKQTKVMDSVLNLVRLIAKKHEVDYRHVTELSIEYIEKYDINVLYVPDEWNTDVHKTYEEALGLMNSRGLDKVDFCLLHGAFNYQIDAALNPKAHNEELWSNLVKYYLFAGHVHFRSQYKNILVAGSFDRLAHGEEQPKGWLSCEIFNTGNSEIKFIENELATKYVTLDVRGKDIEEISTLIDKHCSDFRPRSHIRLFANEDDPITSDLKVLRQKYSHFFFTIKKDIRKDKKVVRTLTLADSKFNGITLDKDNINRIIEDRLVKLSTDRQDVPVKDILSLLMKYL